MNRIRLKRHLRVHPDPKGLGSPDAWLYVSKRLDLTLLPNSPLWSAPVILIDSTPFYRVTARVLLWLQFAGEHLQQQFESGQVARDQLTAYVEAMEVVEGWATVWVGREAMENARLEARAGRLQLPTVYVPTDRMSVFDLAAESGR